MNRKLLSVLALVASLYTLSAIAPPCAVAANRRIVISASDLSTKSVTITIGKKSSVRSVTCYKGVGGKASRVKKTYSFTPYSSLLRSAKANGAKRSVIELYAALKAASVNACKLDIPNLPTPAPTPTPKPTPTPVQNTTPDFLSMSPYTGPFGEDQARTLFDRFAYGAPPERIAQAVADGLAVTIQKLTNYTPEPDLDADVPKRCETHQALMEVLRNFPEFLTGLDGARRVEQHEHRNTLAISQTNVAEAAGRFMVKLWFRLIPESKVALMHLPAKVQATRDHSVRWLAGKWHGIQIERE